MCKEKKLLKKGGWKNRRKMSVQVEGTRQRILCLEWSEQVAQNLAGLEDIAESSCPTLPFPAQRCLQERSGNCCRPLAVHRQRETPLCCQFLCPPGVLVPKHSVFLMIGGASTGTE